MQPTQSLLLVMYIISGLITHSHFFLMIYWLRFNLQPFFVLLCFFETWLLCVAVLGLFL